MLAFLALAVHLAWLAWILLGWLVTRGRPLLRRLHIFSLGWGILVSLFPWTCPLTFAEQYCQARAGLQPYQKSFLEYYVELLVYPDVDQRLLMWCAVATCASLMVVYGVRYRARRNCNW